MLRDLKVQLVYWPTLFWNALLGRWLKVRPWWSEVNDELVLGALPFRSDAEKLYQQGVRAVVNTCYEYRGPLKEYSRLGIKQCYIPTIDFSHPSLVDVQTAVDFIRESALQGERTYVHCKAGRARSATIVLCYLCKYHQMSADEAQAFLLKKRAHVNPRIKDRPVVKRFLES